MVVMAMATSSSVASISVPRAVVAGGDGGSSCCSSLVFSPLCSSFTSSGESKTRSRARSGTACKKVSCVSFQGLRSVELASGKRCVTSSRSRFRKVGLGKVYASVEEGVKSTSETDTSEEVRPPASSNDSSQQQAESLPASPSNPFVGGKISSRIAAKKAGNSQQEQQQQQQQPVSPVAAMPRKAAPKKSAVSSNRTSAPGQLSANAASQLKVARSPNVFTVPSKPAGKGNAASPPPTVSPQETKPVSPVPQPGASKLSTPPNPFRRTPFVPPDWEKAGARAPGAGKRVLDAFKETGRDEGTKFGQPLPPKNIFDEVRRTPEEIAADAFKFEFNPGQLLLVSSFLIIVVVMVGTVLLVWKVGGIHYNEY